jgi:hypothetical protein
MSALTLEAEPTTVTVATYDDLEAIADRNDVGVVGFRDGTNDRC